MFSSPCFRPFAVSPRHRHRLLLAGGLLLTLGGELLAQRTGASAAMALNNVQTDMTSYVQPITNICYIVAAIVGIIGGVQVYSKWTSGDPGAGKTAAGWGAAAVFLILVPSIITSLFGVNMV
jgi:hypothetical protein